MSGTLVSGAGCVGMVFPHWLFTVKTNMATIDRSPSIMLVVKRALLNNIVECYQSVPAAVKVWSVFRPPKGAENLEVVTREVWEGKPQLPDAPRLQHPMDTVRFTHTYTYECYDLDNCSRFMRKIQKAHMEQDMPDIQFNFLIGMDGRIYEGAGWFVDCWKPPELLNLHTRCLDIAYLGNYTLEYPPKEAQALAKKVIDYGVYHKYISERVKVLRITDPDCTVMDF